MKTNHPKPYIIRVVTHIARLPRYIAQFEGEMAKARSTIDMLLEENSKLKSAISQLEEKSSLIDKIDLRITNLQHVISFFKKDTKKSRVFDEKRAINNTVSDNHDYDMFYKKFEDTFRGSKELIRSRLYEHLPIFQGLPKSLKNKKIIDIGSGRGEFLKIMSENGFNITGVDMNITMVESAKSLGLDSVQNDALSFLSTLEPESLAAITGFHIVEHIPFESLMKIFTECYRTISKQGIVIFETPNPNSLSVGADTFYLDPSHLRPIPPGLLSFMLEFSGFSTEIKPLHRTQPKLETDDSVLLNIHETIFGYADYAVVGKKI